MRISKRTVIVLAGLLATTWLVHASPAQALSLADLILFPLDTAPTDEDLSDSDGYRTVRKGEGYQYAMVRTATYDPSGNLPDADDPATWTILSYEGTVTFLEGASLPDQDLVLVLTSLRQGAISDPFDGTLPPFLNGGYITSTLEDDGLFWVRDPLETEDGHAGVIFDGEGEFFPALRFPAISGTEHHFEFQVALRETLSETLLHLNRGFVAAPQAVPEPGSGSLLLGAALALVGLRTRRAPQK